MVWVEVVMVSCCDRLLFVIAKNGMGVMGVSGVRGSFNSAGLLRMVTFKGSFSVSDSLVGMSGVCLGSSTL